MIVKAKITRIVRPHLLEGVQDFLDSIPDTGSVTKSFKYGMIIINVLGDEELTNWIFQKIAHQYGPPSFITRNYVFSKNELDQAKMFHIGGSTAPLDEVETAFARTERTCPRCLSGSRVVSAHIRGPKRPTRHFMQTIQFDMIISAEVATLLLEAGCPPSDLLPARWRSETDRFFLIRPERSAPPLSPRSEGLFVDADHPCPVCNRRYSGSLEVPQALRYGQAFWDSIPENECGFYSSWEYFGAWIEPNNFNPRFASFGRPTLFATKKCYDILRAHCKRQIESIPIFPED